jgi:hypothetical protein
MRVAFCVNVEWIWLALWERWVLYESSFFGCCMSSEHRLPLMDESNRHGLNVEGALSCATGPA